MLIVGPNDLGVLKKFDFALLTTVRYPIDNDLDILILWDHLALPFLSPQRRRRTIPRDGLAIELAISHDRLRVINDQNGRSTLCIDPAVQSDIGLYKVSKPKGAAKRRSLCLGFVITKHLRFCRSI